MMGSGIAKQEVSVRKSLFIGRFQPFHDGHRALINSVLDEGKDVIIAIRDTPVSETDPYSVQARRAMIRDAFPDEHRVEIMEIGDIAEICYGRDVGYTFREIRLDAATEAISGTAIRQASRSSGDAGH